MKTKRKFLAGIVGLSVSFGGANSLACEKLDSCVKNTITETAYFIESLGRDVTGLLGCGAGMAYRGLEKGKRKVCNTGRELSKEFKKGFREGYNAKSSCVNEPRIPRDFYNQGWKPSLEPPVDHH